MPADRHRSAMDRLHAVAKHVVGNAVASKMPSNRSVRMFEGEGFCEPLSLSVSFLRCVSPAAPRAPCSRYGGPTSLPADEVRQYPILPGKMDEWVKIMEDIIIPFQEGQGMLITSSNRGFVE